jgi:hypothetical protein
MNTQQLLNVRHESGLAYIAITHHPELSAHLHPSVATVLENGVPLPGPANATHGEIRHLGGGRYSFWHDAVYFSTPDNSDPRANGRTYAIRYTRNVFDVFTPLIPSRWQNVWARAAGRVVMVARELRPAQLVWGTFYWLCFGYVWLRGSRD